MTEKSGVIGGLDLPEKAEQSGKEENRNGVLWCILSGSTPTRLSLTTHIVHA